MIAQHNKYKISKELVDKMNLQTSKIINKKWSIQILFMLSTKQKVSYKSIKNVLHIPNSTVSLRLTELVQLHYLQKFIYGSINKPHYTEYQITNFGLEYINSLISIE